MEARSAYPELFAVVGNRVPDLRGLFLRGHGGYSAALGVRQNDAVGYHSHLVGIRSSGNAGYPDYNFAKGSEDWGFDYGKTDVRPGANMAEETRPANMAVRYLIRARP